MPFQPIPLVPAIAPFKGRIVSYKHDDADEHVLLCVIQLGIQITYAEAYRVTQQGGSTALGRVDLDLGKDDSVTCWVRRNGDAVVAISESIPDGTTGGSGTTSGIRQLYVLAGAFPPSAVAGTGTIDTYARQQIAALDARLDKIAAGAAG